MAGSTLKLIAVVLPLGLDTLAASLALGLAGFPARHRLRLALLFMVFEAAMPLIGISLGAPLGRAIGDVADYAAAGLIASIGVYLLVAADEDGGPERVLSVTQRGVFGALALGVSISLDELAIGFSAGLLRLPTVATIVAIAAQAFVVTQVGVRLGNRVSVRASRSAEKLAGVGLLGLGAALAVERLAA